MDLKTLVSRLDEFAPLDTACDWDTVGLIVEPTEPLFVKKCLITNDFSETVLDEGISLGVNMIISYHPTIGATSYNSGKGGMKRLTQAEWKQRRLIKCVEKSIALYTPHTTWDSIDGGINDWILESLDPARVESIRETKSTTNPSGFDKNVKINVSAGAARERVLKATSALEGIKHISEREAINEYRRVTAEGGSKQQEVEFLATEKGIVSLIEAIKSLPEDSDSVISTLRIFNLDKPLMKNVGLGRIAWLKTPIKIRDLIEKMKQLLQMKTFRFALGNGKSLDDTVSVIACGAGTSTGLVNNINADFVITGEISHHEILHEVHRGLSLIVTDHSNTERCFLEPFKQKFTRFLKQKYNEEGVEFIVSKIDRDPLQYV